MRRQERKLEAEKQKQQEEILRLEEERIKLEQEALAKAAEAKALALKSKKEKAEENGKKPGPMVTIKRVMQGTNKEPTVTITLKGKTPDKDKLLFTLINGQTEDTNTQTTTTTNKVETNTSQLSKKQRKKLKKEQAKNQQTSNTQTAIVQKQNSKKTKQNSNKGNNKSSNANVENVTKVQPPSNPPDSVKQSKQDKSVKVSLNANKNDSVLNLQMLKLPPGITITKVEGPSTDRKIQLNQVSLLVLDFLFFHSLL